MRGHGDILTLSPKITFAIFQKNNCYRSTTLLFWFGQTIVTFMKLWRMEKVSENPIV